MPTHLDLFSGIGGIALAARWAGFTTHLFCEIDPYCRRVLAKHWPGVPCHDDVRTLDRAALDRHEIEEVALLTGGFPCQPFSSAGKRKGQSDDRFLWPAMLDVVRLIRPAWVVGENVAGFVSLGLDRALADLEGEGYACRAFVFPACAAGAPHQRQRCFLAAYTDSGKRSAEQQQFTALSGLLAKPGTPGIWQAEPGLGRVVDGLSPGLDRRLKGLGNAVVPQQIFPILSAIAQLIPSA